MNLLEKNLGRYPLGVWIALLALLTSFLGWLMQGYSLLDWEEAVSLGLQRGSLMGDELQRALANKERGEAMADLLWPLPIAIVAIIGLLRRAFLGFVAAMMEFAICVYFPLFYVFQYWKTDVMTVFWAVILWGIPSLVGVFALWMNREIFIRSVD